MNYFFNLIDLKANPRLFLVCAFMVCMPIACSDEIDSKNNDQMTAVTSQTMASSSSAPSSNTTSTAQTTASNTTASSTNSTMTVSTSSTTASNTMTTATNTTQSSTPPPTLCETYCALALKNCTGSNQLYPDEASCTSACATFDDTGECTDLSNPTTCDQFFDTVQCRIFHAAAAADSSGDPKTGPSYSCPIAAKESKQQNGNGGDCVNLGVGG